MVIVNKRCFVCGKTSDEVRLYRSTGCLYVDNIRCNKHVIDKKNAVPCVVDPRDGKVWATWPSDRSSQVDFDFWDSLPEADPCGWSNPQTMAAVRPRAVLVRWRQDNYDRTHIFVGPPLPSGAARLPGRFLCRQGQPEALAARDVGILAAQQSASNRKRTRARVGPRLP